MLVEQLSVGRCISLPSIATGGAKAAVFAHRRLCAHPQAVQPCRSASSRASKQRHRAHGRAHLHHGCGALGDHGRDRRRRAARRARGDAQVPRHRDGPQVANDAMDVHGGKGICLGPRNYLGRGYQAVPDRHHRRGREHPHAQPDHLRPGRDPLPSVRAEGNAGRAQSQDERQRVRDFDRALFGHIGFTISNAVRSLVMALTLARFASARRTTAPRAATTSTSSASRASFAFATDVAMLSLGGYLKKKENLSARLGDVLSLLYLASMVLKHHENQGRHEGRPAGGRVGLPHAAVPGAGAAARLPAQLSRTAGLPAAMRAGDLPARPHLLRAGDRLGRQLAELADDAGRDARPPLPPSTARRPGNPLGVLQEALELSLVAEPIESRLRVEGVKTGRVTALDVPGQIEQGLAARPDQPAKPLCCATTTAGSCTSSTSMISRRKS